MVNECVKEDLDAILRIWESSVRATHTFLTSDEIEFYKGRMADIYLDNVKLYKINSFSGETAGFIGVADNKIEMLFISPKYFRQGYGRDLINFAIDYLNVYLVDVNEENEDAYRFYRRQGFKKTGLSEKDGEGKNHPIIHMRLQKF